MKKYYYLIFLGIFILSACVQNTKHVEELYPNGKMKCEYDTFGIGLKDGKYRSYYESGKLKEIGQYVKGKEIGWFVKYSETGSVIRKVEYYLIPKERSTYIRNFDFLDANKNFDNKVSNSNRVYIYNSAGIINNKESYYYTSQVKDTILLGDSVNFKFSLVEPFFKEPGRFTMEVVLKDSKGNKLNQNLTTNVPNYECYIIPKEKGRGFIYGFVIESNHNMDGIFIWYVKESYYVM